MGITLEDVINSANEFKRQYAYWLACRGQQDPETLKAIDELVEHLKEKGGK